MEFGALIIGDEILSGRRQDKHLPNLIESLAKRGFKLAFVHYLADERGLLIDMMRRTFSCGLPVISFGGIGATPDDHTRQCAAAALGLGIELHATAEMEIRARFREETTPLRLKMGEFPVGAEIIPNPYNRIPGFAIQRHYFLPGFPEMAWPMLEWVLDTHFQQYAHQSDAVEASLIVYDAHESQLIPLMESLQRDYHVSIFSLPTLAREGQRGYIELGAKGAREAVAAAMRMLKERLTHLNFEMDTQH